MASISLTVLDAGSPVEGASIIIGEVSGTVLVTGVDGVVTASVPVDFAIAAVVMVESGGARRGTFGPMLFEAGGAYTLDIGGTAP